MNLGNLLQGFYQQMEKSLVYGREKSIELLGMKQECRKLVYELIKSSVDKANA